jgi:hypothetical protein
MAVVPGGSNDEMSTSLTPDAAPPHARSRDARVHAVLVDPGKSGCRIEAIDAVTVIPLMTVGAVAMQLHAAGHCGVPAAEQSPVFLIVVDVVDCGTVHVMLMRGWFGAYPKLVRVMLNVAVQPFAKLGCSSRETITPD